MPGKILESFLEGYGSVIRFFGFPDEDDVVNLKRDWLKVGNYLKFAIQELNGGDQLTGEKFSRKRRNK